MRLRADADILRRGTPLLPALVAVFAALTFAHRARAAAAILRLPAADIWRVAEVGASPAGFCTLGVLSPSSVSTCCSRAISARTS